MSPIGIARAGQIDLTQRKLREMLLIELSSLFLPLQMTVCSVGYSLTSRSIGLTISLRMLESRDPSRSQALNDIPQDQMMTQDDLLLLGVI